MSILCLPTELIPLFCLGICLYGIIRYDWKYGIIPDVLNGPVFLSGLVWRIVTGKSWVEGLLCALLLLAGSLILALCFRYWKDRDGIGGGDIKLMAASGMWLGMEGVFGIPAIVMWLFLSCLLQIPVCLTRKEEFVPFGPALALSLGVIVAMIVAGFQS